MNASETVDSSTPSSPISWNAVHQGEKAPGAAHEEMLLANLRNRVIICVSCVELPPPVADAKARSLVNQPLNGAVCTQRNSKVRHCPIKHQCQSGMERLLVGQPCYTNSMG